MKGEELEKRIVVKPDSFASETSDPEPSVVEKTYGDVHALAGGRNCELYPSVTANGRMERKRSVFHH